MQNIIYRIGGNKLWDVEKAQWIDEAQAISLQNENNDGENGNQGIVDLVTAEGVSNKKYLIKTLEFYGYPLGELALDSEKGIKELLAKLDAEYLTPRTLAGLSTGDQEALARWNEHEEKAQPLRVRLASLETEQD